MDGADSGDRPTVELFVKVRMFDTVDSFRKVVQYVRSTKKERSSGAGNRSAIYTLQTFFLGHMNIRGPQLFYSFFHTLDESSSYWRTICGLELFVFNNQCFDFIYCV